MTLREKLLEKIKEDDEYIAAYSLNVTCSKCPVKSKCVNTEALSCNETLFLLLDEEVDE